MKAQYYTIEADATDISCYIHTCRSEAFQCYDRAEDLDGYVSPETDGLCRAPTDTRPWYAAMLSNGNQGSKRDEERELEEVKDKVHPTT